MNPQKYFDINLAGHCGIYCGNCRHYLARSKGILKEKKLKHGCHGCRVQNKNCAWVKRDCELLRKKKVDFCFECENFPCANLEKLDFRHLYNENVSPVENLLRIKNVGVQQWLKEQEDEWKCTKCGGNICITDSECYDCRDKID